ncbi:MAG TPA: hypothetical protein VFL76_10785 [Edaphocola sp.]|nr:hypothetical protein [Edaphocola sp.]
MKSLPQFILLFVMLFTAIHPLQAQKKKRHASSPDRQKSQAQPEKYSSADSLQQSFKPVKRNTTLPVMVFPGKIRQDSVLIANYTITDGSWEGKLVKTFTFYLPNGVKAAEAMILGISKDACSITTFKDNKMAQVEINVINNTARVKILATYLITNGYL